MSLTTYTRTPAELTIGVVGPHDLIERVMLSRSRAATPAAGPGPAPRLVAAAYRDEQEAADQVTRLGPAIDACLLASRVPYDYARSAGALTCPATFIPLGGSALYAALLQASRDKDVELSRCSIDTLSQPDIDEAFTAMGVATAGVHVRDEPGSPASVAAFHERLARRKATTVAFTAVQSVASRLAASDIPVITLRPTGSDIRAALGSAALLGGYRRLEDAQLALAIVDVPALRDGGRRAAPRQTRDELRLTVHRFLVQEAHRIHATVTQSGDHGFLILATRGSLARATDGFRSKPFADRARSELGLTIEVGIGMGRTATEAESNARTALSKAPGRAQRRAPAVAGLDVPAPRRPEAATRRVRSLETLAKLAEKLTETGSAMMIDAEGAGELLDVTPRTARRLLHVLVEEGLAWPLPPNREPQPGRPRQFYRLVVEHLQPSDADSEAGAEAEAGPEPQPEPQPG